MDIGGQEDKFGVVVFFEINVAYIFPWRNIINGPYVVAIRDQKNTDEACLETSGHIP